MTTTKCATSIFSGRHHSTWAAIILALVVGAGGCAQEVEPSLTVRDFDPADIRMMVQALGTMDADEVAKRRAKDDIDGVARLAKGSCPNDCGFALLDVYIENKGSEPIAPPVLRLDSPTGRAKRLAVSYRGHEISPRRTGRIRWLVELWPEEETLDAHLSSSIFFNVNPPKSEDSEAKPTSDAAKDARVDEVKAAATPTTP